MKNFIWNLIKGKVAEHIRDAYTSSVKVCDECGCLVAASHAVKGRSEVKSYYSNWYCENKEYIHTPYYCKRCAPKEESHEQ